MLLRKSGASVIPAPHCAPWIHLRGTSPHAEPGLCCRHQLSGSCHVVQQGTTSATSYLVSGLSRVEANTKEGLWFGFF